MAPDGVTQPRRRSADRTLGARARRLRLTAGGASFLLGILFLAILHLAPLDPKLQQILIDPEFIDGLPISIQNVMWLVFFLGLGEIAARRIAGRREAEELDAGYLPEDPSVLLEAETLPVIWERVTRDPTRADRFLPHLIQRVVRQFQLSGSTDRAQSLLAASLELSMHEIELAYNMLRYIVWVIPTLGFFGTVVGIAQALERTPGAFEGDLVVLVEMTVKLGTAFYTTVLALILSGILVFLMHLAQGYEETTLNRAGQYCLDNLINRLFER